MSEVNEKNDEIEIDLSQLFWEIKKHTRLLIISTILVAAIAFTFTIFFIDKKYASQSRIYITPKVTEEGVIDNSSLTSGNIMVNNYMSFLTGENLLQGVAKTLDIKYSLVKSSLDVSNDTDTQIIAVRATTKDPQLSKAIVEQTVETFRTDMQELLNIQNTVVVDSAKVDNVPVSPSVKKNTLIGGVIGLVLSLGYVFLSYLLDKRLRNKDEAEAFLEIPVLAEIPWYEG